MFGIDDVALAMAGASVVSGLLGSDAQQSAADTSAAASDRATAAANHAAEIQQQNYQQTRADLQPYTQWGIPALQQLASMMGLGNNTGQPGNEFLSKPFTYQPFDYSMADFYKDPSYQFQQSEGEKALTRGASARGLAQSTPGLKDLMTFNQNLASTAYGGAFSRAAGAYQMNFTNAFGMDQSNKTNTFNYLSSIAGLGQNSAAMTGNIGANSANGAASSLIAGGNAIMAGGQAQAQGILGSASAMNNAVQGGLGNYLTNDRFNQMMQRMPVFSQNFTPTNNFSYNGMGVGGYQYG